MAQKIRNKQTGGTYSDLYSTYGIRLIKGAYDELLRYPPMKEYITNNSRLENGVQYLAKQAYSKIDSKSLTIKFVLEASTEAIQYTRLDSFLTLISSGMFELQITTLNKVFRLVYKSCNRLTKFKNHYATFELKLEEPDPTDRGTNSTH